MGFQYCGNEGDLYCRDALRAGAGTVAPGLLSALYSQQYSVWYAVD